MMTRTTALVVTAPVVTALVLADTGTRARAVESALAAAGAQTRAPDRVLVIISPRSADASPAAEGADGDDAVDPGSIAARDEVEAVLRPARPGLRAALAAAGDHLAHDLLQRESSWLWLVPAGSDPGRRCLEELTRRAAQNAHIAAAGAKRVQARDGGSGRRRGGTAADAADGLVDVGLTLTRSARVVTGVDGGEIDQGQDDWRRDVLALPMDGLLLAEDALVRVGGLDPALPDRWAVVELCHRLWRGGYRVEVVPAARALAPVRGSTGAERRANRAGRLGTALAMRRAPFAVLALLLLPLGALWRALGAVMTHSPSTILDEIVGSLRAAVAGPGIIARSARAASRARTPRSRLAPLFLPRREAVRRSLGSLWTRTLADDERSRRIRRTTWGIAGTTHGADDADFGRHTAWTLALGVLAAVGTLIGLRPLLAGGDLGGGALVPLPADWHETLETAWASWIPSGQGARVAADPLIRLLGHLPVPGPLLVETILLGAIPCAALGAWWAAGALTRAVGGRLVLSATWALAPSLLEAVAQGRWPLALVHTLLPLWALAVARAVGLPHKRSQASVSAAAGAGLLLLVIGAVQAGLVVLAAAALAIIALLVPGRRVRLLWVLVPSLALHLPYLPRYLAHPRTLLAVGAQDGIGVGTDGASTLLDALRLAPGSGWQALAGTLGADGAAWAPLLLLIPVAACALAAPFLRGDAGTVGRLAALLTALGVGAAIVTVTVPTGVVDGQVLRAPANAAMSATLLALLLGAGCMIDALARRGARMSMLRRRATALAALVIGASTAALVLGWSLALPGALEVTRGELREIPAAAADQGRSEARTRTLVLGDGAARTGAVPARLVRAGGPDATQTSALSAARDLERARAQGTDGSAKDDAAVLRTTAALLASDTDPTGLQDLAVGYVLVPGDPEQDPALITALDTSSLLEKVTQGTGGSLWRVIDQHGRATIGATAPGQPREDLAASVIDVEAPVGAAPAMRTVSLAENRSAAWRASLDGRELEPVTVDGWAQGFLVPPDASGRLVITTDAPAVRLAQLLLALALALTALVAVPWRGRAHVPEERTP
ncbi:glycosyltransferase family 2 protein [Brachybacterium nesterenkovii]|nr:hypothetical protein [Brachybacterium nesterenkovii]